MSPNLPTAYVPGAGARSGECAGALGASADAGFAAQLLAEGGGRRGLKGGPPVLEAARRAYLEAEWSGGADRRSMSGRATLQRI